MRPKNEVWWMSEIRSFQELKTKLFQELSEATTDISHLVLFFNLPARLPGIGYGQGDNYGKDILLIPPNIGGGRERTSPTCYICNKR